MPPLRSLRPLLFLGIALAGVPAYSCVQSEGEQTSVTKQFRLSAEQIRPLATGRGGAVASDRITVDGQPVGYMYRSAPRNHLDSGWAFLAGDETDTYMEESSNHAIYDVTTIANYDPEIIPLLDAPVGSAFIRTPSGLVLDPQGAPAE
jgi:hypothetical protein